MIVSLVVRGGSVRSFHPKRVDKDTVQTIVKDNLAEESRLMSDEPRLHKGLSVHFADHQTRAALGRRARRLTDR